MKVSLSLSLPLLLVAAGAQVSFAKWDKGCQRCADIGNDDHVSPFQYHCDRRVDNTICQEMSCKTMPYENTPCNDRCPTLMCRPMGGKYDCPPVDCGSCNSKSDDHACVPQEEYCPFVTYDPRCCPASVTCVPNMCSCPPVSPGCSAYTTRSRGEDGCVKCLEKCNGTVRPRGGKSNPTSKPTAAPRTGEGNVDLSDATCPPFNCKKHSDCDDDEICTMEPLKYNDCFGASRNSDKCCMMRKCYKKKALKAQNKPKCWGKSKPDCRSANSCKWFHYYKPNGQKQSNCREQNFEY